MNVLSYVLKNTSYDRQCISVLPSHVCCNVISYTVANYYIIIIISYNCN